MARRSPLVRYGFALALAVAACGLRLAFDPVWGHSLPFVLFFPAIVLAAWYGGFGPGFLATTVAAVMAWFFWLARAVPTMGMASAALGLAAFVGSGIAVSVLCEALLSTHARALAEADAARHATERLRVAQSFADAGLWDWNLRTGEVYTSPEFNALFDLPATANLSRESFLALVLPEDRARVDEELAAVVDGRVDRLDLVFRVHSADRDRWVRAVGRCDRDRKRIAGITVDVTENVEAREALRASEERLRETSLAKDRLIAMLSHELRNPIHAIASAVALQERATDAASTVRAREIVARQVRHLERILADMLDVTRAVSGKLVLRPEPVDFAVTTKRALDALFATGRTAQHQIAAHLEDVWVEGDPTRLDQVVTNLVTNAVKYTPPGKRIDVEVTREGGDAVLRVRDQGAGIAPELRERVFEPFVQGEQTLDRSQGGLGVGLSLVQRIVELHGGKVVAESDGPGTGSCFVVRIPAREAVSTKEAPSKAPNKGRRKVLVVEDHDDSREMLKTMLEAAGHDVHGAADGLVAVEEALRWRPDVVLLDVGLPAIDGFEAARRIRAGGGTMRLVALTGYGQPDDVARSRASGFDEHLVKPVDARRVTEEVEKDADPPSAPATAANRYHADSGSEPAAPAAAPISDPRPADIAAAGRR